MTASASLGPGWMTDPLCWSYTGWDWTLAHMVLAVLRAYLLLPVHGKENCSSKTPAVDMVLCTTDLALGKECDALMYKLIIVGNINYRPNDHLR